MEIDQGVDKRTIKRAYARKLKSIKHDAQPEAFMSLREAYETALAKTSKPSLLKTFLPQRVELYDEDDFENEIQAPDPEIFDPRETLFQETLLSLHKPHPQTTVDMRQRQKQWDKIVSDIRIEAIDDFTWFQNRFLHYLLNHTKFQSNIHIDEYLQQLKNYVTPILRPPLSNHVFELMGWNAQNIGQAQSVELQWLSYQFGVDVQDDLETYWYYDKVKLDKSVKWISVEESGIHPLTLLLSTVAFLITAGLFASVLVRILI